MKKNNLTENSSQTKTIGKTLAEEIIKLENRKKALVLGLRGDLGGGKTTFMQGFAKGLKIRDKVLSPTFLIMRKFKVNNSGFDFLYHFDCYRCLSEKEVINMDFKKIIDDPKNIVVIEWAEKIKSLLPKTTLWIDFDFIDCNKRKIVINFRNGKI
jgi:tRNA threonylcarbamoyladenosine biosynthesis protein TsaE